MTSHAFSFVLFLFACFVCSGALESTLVDGDGLNRVLLKNNNVVALFTRLTPQSCPECDLAENAFDELEAKDVDCVAVTIDCDQNELLCRKYEFRHLPQVLLFNEEVGIYDYREPFIYTEALETFIKVHIAPKNSIVESTEELEKEIQANKVLVVGFFLATENHKTRGSFKRTAGQLFTEFQFVEVLVESEEAEVLKENDALLNTIKLYKHFGGEVVSIVYDEETVSRRKLAQWIDLNAPWLVTEGEPSFANARNQFRSHSAVVAYLDYANEALKEQMISDLEVVANSFTTRLSFHYTDGSASKYEPVFERWGDAATLPFVLITNPNSHKMYLLQDEINQDTIESFCNEYLDDQLEAFVVKQKEPEENQGSVQVIVHDSWRSIVHDATSDVVVFFYLPLSQCDHCVPFLKKYESLAGSLNIPGLVFAKLDVYANAQVPGVHVSNFPTIQLFPKSNKFQEKTFSGPRTTEAIEEWIRSSLSVKESRFTEEEQRLGLGDII